SQILFLHGITTGAIHCAEGRFQTQLAVDGAGNDALVIFRVIGNGTSKAQRVTKHLQRDFGVKAVRDRWVEDAVFLSVPQLESARELEETERPRNCTEPSGDKLIRPFRQHS